MILRFTTNSNTGLIFHALDMDTGRTVSVSKGTLSTSVEVRHPGNGEQRFFASESVKEILSRLGWPEKQAEPAPSDAARILHLERALRVAGGYTTDREGRDLPGMRNWEFDGQEGQWQYYSKEGRFIAASGVDVWYLLEDCKRHDCASAYDGILAANRAKVGS